MKIEVEVEEEDVKLLKDKVGLDAQILIQELANIIVNGLKELYLAHQAGIPMNMKEVCKLGTKAGKAALRKAEEAAEEGESKSD